MGLLDGFKKLNTLVDRKIKKIQRSSNETKKKWLIVVSILAIVLIISLWIVYLNITLPSLAPADAEQEVQESVSFFQAVSEGVTVLYTKVESGVIYFIEEVQTLFQKKREFEITN